MNKIKAIKFFLLAAAILGIAVLAIYLPTSGPKAEIDLGEHDFGKVRKQDGVVSKNFEIKNTGGEKLIIGDITTSCGCTSAEINKKEISAAESAIVKVNFDPNFHEEPKGRFSRSVFVPTNDPENPEIELKIFVETVD